MPTPSSNPARLSVQEFWPIAYRWMFLSRKIEERIVELFRKGYVKGTVTLSMGNEATAVGMGLPFRPGKDIFCLLHRDFATHMILGNSMHEMLCQYIANAESPTHGREGNVHHGKAGERRFPMISHLGNMLSLAVGGVWAARQNGEDVVGLAVIGDGGSSSGDFHESINLASVRRSPVLFLIENNHYAYSTPTRLQYHCEKLSDRAVGYGIPGKTVDGTDAWTVYTSVCDALDAMRETQLPYLLECMTLRLEGHAVYDKAEYISSEQKADWYARGPLKRGRASLEAIPGWNASRIATLEAEIEAEVEEAVSRAVRVQRPTPFSPAWDVFSSGTTETVEPFRVSSVRNLNAVTHALDYLLRNNPTAFVAGMDIGPMGSAFKACKGLHESYGPDRVLDMPLCESAITGFSLGASQTGARPIIEYQFADFSTEAVTQLGLNAGTWYFRSGQPAPLLVRLPCGGGITLGAFHQGEFEGLWSRFSGLKILYPATPQEMFEALVAGFYDPNPVLVLEHKLLYSRGKGDIDFDGKLAPVWRSRRCVEGSDITIVALGAMIEISIEAAAKAGISADIWNPFCLCPLDFEPIAGSVARTGRLLVVQECNEAAGMGDRFVSLATRAVYGALKCAPAIVCPPFVPIPFAPELENAFRPNAETVQKAIKALMGDHR